MKNLKITGMTCGMCVKHVKEAIESVPGVSNVMVVGVAPTSVMRRSVIFTKNVRPHRFVGLI